MIRWLGVNTARIRGPPNGKLIRVPTYFWDPGPYACPYLGCLVPWWLARRSFQRETDWCTADNLVPVSYVISAVLACSVGHVCTYYGSACERSQVAKSEDRGVNMSSIKVVVSARCRHIEIGIGDQLLLVVWTVLQSLYVCLLQEQAILERKKGSALQCFNAFCALTQHQLRSKRKPQFRALSRPYSALVECLLISSLLFCISSAIRNCSSAVLALVRASSMAAASHTIKTL